MEKCPYCEGKGWYWVQNGPDDVDKEPCDCMEDYEYEQQFEKEAVNG